MSEEFTKFITVYNETKKIVVLSEFEDLYDRIKNVYKNESGFPKDSKSCMKTRIWRNMWILIHLFS